MQGAPEGASWLGQAPLFTIILGLCVCAVTTVRADDESAAADREIAAIDRSRTRGTAEVVASRVAPLRLYSSNTTTVVESRPVTRTSGVAVNAFSLPEEMLYWSDDETRVAQSLTDRDVDENPFENNWNGDAWQEGKGSFAAQLQRRPQVPLDPKVVGLKRLVRKIGARHVRKFLRGEVDDRFDQDPSMNFLAYEQERNRVAQFGRSSRVDADTEELRNTVLEGSKQIERSIVLANWGPFRLDDRGSLRVDFKKLQSERPTPETLEFAPEEEQAEPLFTGRSYRVRTDARFRPKVGKLLDNDFREFLGKMGVSVEVDFFSEVLERRYMKAELETTVDPDGEAAFFLNFELLGS